MTFYQKLERRVADLGLNKAEASRRAGLNATMISSYLAKPKSIPRGDIAFKIAKALGVPVDWLLDDQRGWPPPAVPATPSLRRLSDDELMLEVATRFRRDTVQLLEHLAQAERVDWEAAAQQLEEVGHNDPIPESVRPLLPIVATFTLYGLRVALKWLDPRSFADSNHSQMPGSERPVEDFSELAISQRRERLVRTPGFCQVMSRLSRLAIDEDTAALFKGHPDKPAKVPASSHKDPRKKPA